jgi:hypothetical protein
MVGGVRGTSAVEKVAVQMSNMISIETFRKCGINCRTVGCAEKQNDFDRNISPM